MFMSSWHLSKNITISTILSILILFVSQIYAYGKAQQKLEELSRSVQTAQAATIDKETIHQMLKNRDLQIKNVENRIERLSTEVKENQKLLIQILNRTNK